MTFYMYLYIMSFFSYFFLDFLIKRGLLGINLRNKLIKFQDNQIKFIIYLFVFIFIIYFTFMPDEVIYFLDKETETALANVENNNVNIYNPNINIPSSFSKAITSLGIGGSIAAGITTAGTLTKTSAPAGVKLGLIGVGGLLGGGIFVLSNYVNTVMQVKAESNSKTNIVDTGSFSAKSMSDNTDNNAIDAVLGMFNINLIFNICVFWLLLALFILYFGTHFSNKLNTDFFKRIFPDKFVKFLIKLFTYTSNTNKVWMLIAWVLLVIASLANIFMAGFFIENLDTIMEIYQNSKK